MFRRQVLRHFDGAGNNWGDVISPLVLRQVTGRDLPVVGHRWRNYWRHEVILAIGSILHFSDRRTTVWGSGFIEPGARLKQPPRRVCAVRGPLTRSRLAELGVACPEVYGDPALLFPRVYSPPRHPRYRLGIIPHYVDAAACARCGWEAEDVKIIDICGGIEQVAQDICSCERIASSSLHGIIAADAYGIPSTWLEFSDRVLGGGFKFRDYFLSVQRPLIEPLRVTPKTELAEVEDHFTDYRVQIDLDLLAAACPVAIAKGTGEARNRAA